MKQVRICATCKHLYERFESKYCSKCIKRCDRQGVMKLPNWENNPNSAVYAPAFVIPTTSFMNCKAHRGGKK